MSATSKIEWTEHTWNPVTGCSKVSPGCAHCYAEVVALRFWPTQYPPIAVEVPIGDCTVAGDANITYRDREFTDVQCHEDRLDQPLKRRKPTTYFVNSMSDLFHEDVPDDFIDRVFAVMALCPQHTFQILTKRAERMRAYVAGLSERLGELWDLTNQPTWVELPAGRSFPRFPENWPLPNVWFGVSAENRRFLLERSEQLARTTAAVRFFSLEPLLEDVLGALQVVLSTIGPRYPRCEFDWVIVGGESGSGARPLEVEWTRSIVAQCRAAGVAVFVKQLGANIIDRNDAGFDGDTPRSWPMDTDIQEDIHGFRDEYQGAPVRVLLTKKAGDPAEWPEDLRVREFPKAHA